MVLDAKLRKQVVTAVDQFLETGEHRDVVVEYTAKKDGSATKKFLTVEDGCAYFKGEGFEENGLKSFVKPGRVNVKHGYVVFETRRAGDALATLIFDMAGIEEDLNRKVVG